MSRLHLPPPPLSGTVFVASSKLWSYRSDDHTHASKMVRIMDWDTWQRWIDSLVSWSAGWVSNGCFRWKTSPRDRFLAPESFDSLPWKFLVDRPSTVKKIGIPYLSHPFEFSKSNLPHKVSHLIHSSILLASVARDSSTPQQSRQDRQVCLGN